MKFYSVWFIREATAAVVVVLGAGGGGGGGDGDIFLPFPVPVRPPVDSVELLCLIMAMISLSSSAIPSVLAALVNSS